MCDNIGVIANVANRQMGTTDLWLLTHEDLRKGARISAVLDFLTPALAESLEAGARVPICKRAGSAFDAIPVTSPPGRPDHCVSFSVRQALLRNSCVGGDFPFPQ